MGQTTTTTTEDRALALLGTGVSPEVVASALGVSKSRISQLLSDEKFAAEVARLRFDSLTRHNERDSEYDKIEDDLIERLKDCIPLMMRPEQILKGIQVINAAKRRGTSAPEQITQQQTVVSLVMPVQVIQKFTTNIHNQVVQTGDQKLVTVQSGTLLDKIKAKTGQGNENGSQRVIEDSRNTRISEEAIRLEPQTRGADSFVPAVPAI